MTDLLERVVRLEVKTEIIERRQDEFERIILAKLDGLSKQIEALNSVLSMGRGGWRVIVVLGTVVSVGSGIVFWILDHITSR